MAESIQSDVTILGSGIVGLSLAWELAEHGQRVVVIRNPPSRGSASWAAAGILPPGNPHFARDPLDRLQGLSHELYPQWIDRLQARSDVDVEYLESGGLHLARGPGEAASLQAVAKRWSEEGIRVIPVDLAELRVREPLLSPPCIDRLGPIIFHLPDERQVRPPKLLAALEIACLRRECQVLTVEGCRPWSDGSVWHLEGEFGAVRARTLCVCAGAWSGDLLRERNVRLEIEPRRGQIAIFSPIDPCLSHLINVGPRYLVPRRDGRVLVGSTVEEVGFELSTTDEEIMRLRKFATDLVPRLADMTLEDRWSGLRPWTGDGYPYLGAVPGNERLFVAAGHFRSGIQMAPITARLMRQLIIGQPMDADLTPFRLDRE